MILACNFLSFTLTKSLQTHTSNRRSGNRPHMHTIDILIPKIFLLFVGVNSCSSTQSNRVLKSLDSMWWLDDFRAVRSLFWSVIEKKIMFHYSFLQKESLDAFSAVIIHVICFFILQRRGLMECRYLFELCCERNNSLHCAVSYKFFF